MQLTIIKKALKASSPAFFGYVGLGLSFGFLLQKTTGVWYLAPLMSLLVFAGAAQFIATSLLALHGSLYQILLSTFIVNLRHVFYGLSFVGTFPNQIVKKTYMIFGLTDESYSILTGSKERHLKNFDFFVILFSHGYWVLGSLLGALLALSLPFNLSFLKFSLTALFIVMAVEQACQLKAPSPFVYAVLASAIALVFFRPEMLLMAMLLLTIFIYLHYQQAELGK